MPSLPICLNRLHAAPAKKYLLGGTLYVTEITPWHLLCWSSYRNFPACVQKTIQITPQAHCEPRYSLSMLEVIALPPGRRHSSTLLRVKSGVYF